MNEIERPQPKMMKWAQDHLALYLRTGGREGHLFDFTPINGEGMTPNCLIKHIGRKSGRTLILPLIYGIYRGEVVICASKGGAPDHPAWVWDLMVSVYPPYAEYQEKTARIIPLVLMKPVADVPVFGEDDLT